MEEEDCEIVGEVERTPLKSPLMKKLKQSRLPFARLDSKTPQKTSSLPTQKKRKLSGSGVSGSCAKTVGIEVKLDAPASKKKQKVQKKIGKRQIRLKVNQKNSDKPERKRKRGGPSSKEKKSHVLENNKKLSKSSRQLMSDDEVSSSVDDEVEAPKAKKKSIENIRKLLPLLLCKEPTQQAVISTSTEELSDKEEKENLEDISEVKNHDNVINSENESEEIEINGRKEEENMEKEADGNKCNDDSKNNKVTEVNAIKQAEKEKATVGVHGVGKKFEGKTELSNRQEKENVGKEVKKTTFCNDSENIEVIKENNADTEEVKKTPAKPSSIGKNSGKEDSSETLDEICSTVENEYMEMDSTRKGESVENEEEIKELTQKTEEGDNNEDDKLEMKDQKQIEREGCELELNESDIEKNKEMKREMEQNIVAKEPKILEKFEEEVKERKEVENKIQEQEEDFKKENVGGNEKKDCMVESNKTVGQEQKLKTIEVGKTKDSGDKAEIVSEDKKEKTFDVRERKVKEVKGRISDYLNVVKNPTKEIGNIIKECNKERCTDVGEKKNKLLEQEEKIVESTVNEGSEMICEKEKESVNTCVENEEANGKKNEGDGMDTDKESERMLNSGSLNSKFSLPSPKGPLSGSKIVSHVRPKRIATKPKEGERKKQLKVEVREKLKQERQKKKLEILAEKKRLRKEKEEERQKQREEKEKIKEDMKRKRQEELDAKRQKKEEDLQRKEEEKKLKEEEKRQKEEEKRQKDEEKRQKEEARKQAEEEKQRQKDKLKKKFASFFVAKKHDHTEMEEESDNGLFKQFRVKEDMQMAPRNRTHFSESQRLELDRYISDRHVTSSELYLELLKAGNYVKQKSKCTWPPEDKKEDMEDIEIIEEDEDLGGMDGMIEDTAAGIIKGRHLKAKFLCFCENRRPAYRGTWSKSSSSVSARRPFAKHDIFDYEYDSDDDWEEEEAGESLSDSEGEEKEEEEGDQYEVDNDFFVPHGYLSDDEGRSDEEDGADENLPQDDNTKHKEKLKQKQAEFEEEMKKKTKQLKPRIMGSLWMADANNNPAYSQLLKILNPHKVVNLCSQFPIGTRHGGLQPAESKDRKLEEEGVVEDKNSVKQKFVKTFPEEAVPALIQLLHGNRHGKAFLSREFSDYWRKRGDMEGNCFIAKRKVELKIQELGHWRKCPDEGPFHKVMMWYVSKEVREEYGLAELSLPNTWNYINKPRERREVNFEDSDDAEDGSKASKTGKLIPITAFAKKITPSPVSTATSPTSSPTSTNASPQQDETSKAETGSGSGALSAASPLSVTDVSPSSSSITKTSRKSVFTPGQQKKKVAFLSVPRGQEITGDQRAYFASFSKKSGEASLPRSSVDCEKEEKRTEIKDKEEVECITLE